MSEALGGALHARAAGMPIKVRLAWLFIAYAVLLVGCCVAWFTYASTDVTVHLSTTHLSLVAGDDFVLDFIGIPAERIHVEGLQAIEQSGKSVAHVQAVDVQISPNAAHVELPALQQLSVDAGTRLRISATKTGELQLRFPSSTRGSPLALAHRGALDATIASEDGTITRMSVHAPGFVSLVQSDAPTDVYIMPRNQESCIVCAAFRPAAVSFNVITPSPRPSGPTFAASSCIVEGKIGFKGYGDRTHPLAAGDSLLIEHGKIALRRIAMTKDTGLLDVDLDVTDADVRAGALDSELTVMPNYVEFFRSGPLVLLFAALAAGGALIWKFGEKIGL